MTPQNIFNLHLAMGYVPWLLWFVTYGWPRLRTMEGVDAQRAIASLHAFRFLGLVFLVPGVVGTGIPHAFAAPAAYGDFATGLLAMAAMMTIRIRPLFWLLVAAFNLLGFLDILNAYYHGVTSALPAGELGAGYFIVIVYVPILMITHVAAFYLLLARQSRAVA